MKAKVNRGNGFRGLLNYAMGEEKKHELVATNMAGTTPRELAAEFKVARQLRPGVKKPVVEFSLNLPHGEDVSSETWGLIVEDFLNEMEFDTSKHQYVAPKHNDRDHKHVHIIGSRIGLDGTMWHGKFDVFKAIEATQMLEKKYGLTLTPGLDSVATEEHKAKPSKGQLERTLRTGDAPVLTVLQTVIDEALADSPTTTAFLERLDAAGVTAVPNVASTGTMNGFSFGMDGVFFKGKQLGDSYTWKQLQTRGLTYDKDRESGELIRRKEQASRSKGADGARDPGADRGAFTEPGIAVGTEPGHVQGAAQPNDEISGGRRAVDQRVDSQGLSERESTEPGSEALGVDQQPESVLDADRSQRERLDSWSRAADSAAALAAPLDRAAVENVAEPVTKALQAKQVAWQRQSDALGAPSYRITLKGRREGLPTYVAGKRKDRDEQFYTQAEVTAMLPKLSRENARGFDVYVTPIDPGHHYVLLDDMRADAMKSMMGEGYQPCIVQESSHDNFQAIIKLPRDQFRNEQTHANKIVTALNKQYGDPNLSGVVRPFRMAGFSNKKPGRSDAFTKIVHAVNRICSKASGMLKSIIDKAMADDKTMTERFDRERQITVAATSTDAPRSTVDAYRREYAMQIGLARKNAWSEDESRYDWYATIGLLKAGHDPSAVKQALLTASPHVTDRKHDPDDYAQRTVDKAMLEEDVQKAIQARSRPSLFDAVRQEEKQSVEKGQRPRKSDDFEIR